MYPLCTWGYEGVERRLKLMLDAELHPEVIVVSYQVIEQTVKRTMRSELSERRVRLAKDGHTLKLVPAKSRADVDASLAAHAQSLDALRKAWGLVMRDTPYPRLPALLNAICGNSTWDCMTSTASFKPNPSTGIVLAEPPQKHKQELLFGLAMARHKLVHSSNAVDDYTVRHLAPFGAKVAIALLSPDGGIGSRGYRSPLLKCFPFRTSN